MAKNLKLNIKNTQIAEAIKLDSLKEKLAKKKAGTPKAEEAPPSTQVKEEIKVPTAAEHEEARKSKEEGPRIKARSKSVFSEGSIAEPKTKPVIQPEPEAEEESFKAQKAKTTAELRREFFGEDVAVEESKASSILSSLHEELTVEETKPEPVVEAPVAKEEPPAKPAKEHEVAREQAAVKPEAPPFAEKPKPQPMPRALEKLGPTGRHVKDLYQKPAPQPRPPVQQASQQREPAGGKRPQQPHERRPVSEPAKEGAVQEEDRRGKAKARDEEEQPKKAAAKVKEFRDVKPARKDNVRSFDARDRQGLRQGEDEDKGWRKKKFKHKPIQEEPVTIRPTQLTIRVPIAIKDLAAEMKLKASQLIAKLFLQGMVVTLNDLLDDETTIQLLGQEFGCEITIDSSEEKRIRITDKTIKEEIQAAPREELVTRAPVVAFMGHVDHGKTSLIDAIRKSNRAAGEAGAITQHIGAFKCSTAVGDITILDTPGHEAFSAMRARGADVTDIVVLVIAGDEGMRMQTIEAMQHAKAAGVTIIVAINKSDKPNFNPENVYRQLADQELLPEAWGGQTITVNCSAVTAEGIQTLLEMLALQAEVLELKANPHCRARGSVLESEMHKGMGSVATVLVQNGSLKKGDAVVFAQHWGRIKTMRDEDGRELTIAGPSTPVEITGLSGLPEAGQEFVVVKNEKEAREISEAREQGLRQFNLQQKKKISIESMLQQAGETGKKILNVVLRADVQGSLEALKAALLKIESQKAELNIISFGVGEISESDVNLAAGSKGVVIGFHTQIESHAEDLVKQLGVQVRLHDIIYHAVDDVKLLLTGLLDKIAVETEKGSALVKAVFKASNYGSIAGCQVIEGVIQRNNQIRQKRNGEVIWKGSIASLKRVKEDVREVAKGFECGILLNNNNDVKENDILEAYEITYITQEL